MGTGATVEVFAEDVRTAATLSIDPLIVVELDSDGRACIGVGPFVATDVDDAVMTAAALLALLLRERVPDGGEFLQ
jgi:hypothetical protein